MSRIKGQESPAGKASHSSGPSRIAHFSPFRRGASFHSQSSDGLVNEVKTGPGAGAGRGLGNVSEVPSIAKASAPLKPPKPVGLRVKKAKALSISLLTGNTGAAAFQSQAANCEAPTSIAQKRQSRILLPVTPPIQKQHNFEITNDALPSRAQSSMGFYQEYGPQKGLASTDWSVFEARDGTYSKKKKLSIADKDGNKDKTRSSELFIISRRPSAADTASTIPQPSTTHNSFERLEQKRSDTPRQRSQSSLGMNSTEFSRKANASPSAAAAIPFLNPYTARAHSNPSEAKVQAKKSTPSPLSLSGRIRRNSYFNELDRGPNSAPISSVSNQQSLAPPHSLGNHARTSSASSNKAFASHIALPKMLPRYRTQSHAATLDYNPTSSSSLSSVERASSPLPPPPLRHKHSRTIGNDGMNLRVPGSRLGEDNMHPRSSSPFERGGSLQALGQQLGGIGVAVGKRGWDMMKNWNSAGPSSPLSSHHPRASSTAAAPSNEATKLWIAAPEPPSSIPTKGGVAMAPAQTRPVNQGDTGGGRVFGRPLKEGVLLTRLTQREAKASSSNAQLSALDLGSEFSINLPELGSESRQSTKQRVAVDRQEARRQYLPAVVVRCIEAIEKWGVEEEGIYRLSGRSSHTAKLKIIFDNSSGQTADLQLVDIGPAELDLNSVCSLLKAYLRALPDLLLTSALSNEFNEAVRGVCGVSAVSEMTAITSTREQAIRERQQKHSTMILSTPETQSDRVAKAITPLMKRLPAVNWYLLREIAYHLGDLTREENVKKTKMTLSNLCLVLAPTLSLSVAMVRMFVEAREQLFNETWPLPDNELDNVQSGENKPPLPSRGVKASHAPTLEYSRDSSRPSSHLAMWDNDWTAKRTSVATLKCAADLDKRNSTSSMATLQELNSKSGNEGIIITSPATRPTSDFFSLSGSSMDISASSASSLGQIDNDDDNNSDAPPIAAQYLRKRSSSIANSIGSSLSSKNPYTRSMHICKAPSSTSLYSIALHTGSTMDSSAPSSVDRNSPRTADDHWPQSVSSMVVSRDGCSSGSNASLASLYKSANGGALDRPRPTTPNPTRFFSSR